MIMIRLLLNLVVIGRPPATGEKEVGGRPKAKSSESLFPERLFFGGSHVASIEEAPYVVALVEKDEHGTFNVPFRTGAIISEQWVLSAAHCVDALGTEEVTFEVIAGCDSLAQLRPEQNTSFRQVRKPIELRIHPFYRTHAAHNETRLGGYDVVLIRVASFVFGPGVNRIGLSAIEWKGRQIREAKHYGEYFIEAECTAFGWGRVEPKVPTEFLRTANFTARHGNGGCSICVNDDRSRRIICTTPLSGHSVCPGDSGGPLVCRGLLAGVAHSMCLCTIRSDGRTVTEQPGCGRDNVFSTWMYVCPMLNWIQEVVPDTPKQPASCRSQSLNVLPGLLPGFFWCFLLLYNSANQPVSI